MAASIALIAAGCSEEVTFENTGTACLSPTEGGWPSVDVPGQRFEEDETIYVTVHLDDCISSSCNIDPYADCQALVTGDQIVITSNGGYTDESGAFGSCTTDCIVLEATCQTTGPLAAGDYLVTYGETEIHLSVPSLTGNYCVPTLIP